MGVYFACKSYGSLERVALARHLSPQRRGGRGGIILSCSVESFLKFFFMVKKHFFSVFSSWIWQVFKINL